MKNILGKLSGGDLRSEGKAEEVAKEVIKNPGLLAELLEGIKSKDKVIRGRTAMSLEIISREDVKFLEEYLSAVFELAKDTIPQVRWHVAEILGRIEKYNEEDLRKAVAILSGYLKDESMIVRGNSVLALADVARREAEVREEIISKIESMRDDKGAGVRKRVERVLKKVEVVPEIRTGC